MGEHSTTQFTYLYPMKPKTKIRKIPVPKPGNLIVVTFLDHAEDGKVLPCRVAGWVHSIDEGSIDLISWDYADSKLPRHPDDTNLKFWGIVRSAIISIEILK